MTASTSIVLKILALGLAAWPSSGHRRLEFHQHPDLNEPVVLGPGVTTQVSSSEYFDRFKARSTTATSTS